MKLFDLWTPKVRRATGQLSLDLLKITGKVAVAGTAGLVGALASAAANTSISKGHEEEKEWFADTYSELEDGYRNGYEGYGYYMGGFKVDDD